MIRSERLQLISGNSGDNTMRGLDGNDTIRGGFGDETLFGGNGRDELDGGNGADVMEGGAGDDTYVVGSTEDRVTEAANSGTDTVRSSVTFTLGANVENLTRQGLGTINGNGNALDNRIIGSGTNILRGLDGDDHIIAGSRSTSLDGGRGADVLQGGADEDFYFVNNSGEVVIESANGGVADIVIASISYTLGANVERLGLTGAGDISGTGNELNNTMTGNTGANVLNGLAGDDYLYGNDRNDTLRGGNGNDVLEGGAGSDRLEGGFGNDAFVFYNISDSGPTASTRDIIISFDGPGRAVGDLIDLSAIRLPGQPLESLNFLGFVPSLFPEPTEAGALWLRSEGSDTLVFANIDGNGGSDFSIRVADGATAPAAYSALDFIL